MNGNGSFLSRLGRGFLAAACVGAASLSLVGAEADFLSRTRQLTFQGKTGEAYFSPDGGHLIFQSEREPGNPFYQIYIMDLETGDLSRVSPGMGKTTCAFFQPGTDRVIFASTHADPATLEHQKAELEFRATGQKRRYAWDYDEWMDIYSARRDGSDPKRLTTARGYDAEGGFSPDGQWIVFSSNRDAYADPDLTAEQRKQLEVDPAFFAEIYLMRADGSEQRRLTRKPGYDGGPFFTADGQRIVWRRFDEKGLIANVFTMRLDGSDVRQVTAFDSMSWAPFPHPSGEYFIFTSNKHGFENFELFLVDVAGRRQPVRVTETDGFDGLPVFSPDGKTLCWTSTRTADKQSQLFLGRWNHGAALAALAAAPLRAAPEAAAPPLTPAIREEEARALVEILAAPEMEGRLTGTPAAARAADFIAGRLESFGLKPGVGEGWRQPFEFTAGVRVAPEGSSLAVAAHGEAEPFKLEEDFRPLPFSAEGELKEAGLVFVGYGLKVPGKPGEAYDSYAGLDVTNKIVVALRYVPEEVTPARRQTLNRYAGLRYKAMIAREHGAKGILVVSGPNSPNPGELISLSSDGSSADSGILAGSISGKTASLLLQFGGKNLKEVQSGLDQENPHFEGSFPIPAIRLGMAVKLVRERRQDANVVGILHPSPSAGPAEYVMLGAHYDHLGLGDGHSSLAESPGGEIHAGADDNASGVAAVLEVAHALAAARDAGAVFPRGFIFGFWSGEELGLLGSSHFAEHPPVPLSNIVAYVNFDMVGRLRENKLNLQGAGSSTNWARLIEKRNVAAGFDLSVQEDPYLPTDVTAFYPKGVPVLAFFTGSHEEYHKPADLPATLDYEGIARIATFARGLAEDLAKSPERPSYAKIERASGGGNRDAMRIYIGSIPDYATEVAGVKLSGVRGGSPADKGGLKGGDVIVEFAGQKIANIYDYTYAIDAAKIGQPILVKVRRGEEVVELTVTPEARK